MNVVWKQHQDSDSKMDYLTNNVRLKTRCGCRPDDRDLVDFVLTDQIVPAYNRFSYLI